LTRSVTPISREKQPKALHLILSKSSFTLDTILNENDKYEENNNNKNKNNKFGENYEEKQILKMIKVISSGQCCPLIAINAFTKLSILLEKNEKLRILSQNSKIPSLIFKIMSIFSVDDDNNVNNEGENVGNANNSINNSNSINNEGSNLTPRSNFKSKETIETLIKRIINTIIKFLDDIEVTSHMVSWYCIIYR